jgi:hypothetical protein
MALHFKESIEGTIELLRKQKETAAAEKKEDVAVILPFTSRGTITDNFHEQKIILAGGFSSSNALQERVKEEFPRVNILTPKKL